MNTPGLIIETDIGYDADDYMTLLHFVMRDVQIHALLLSPGHPSQVALCRFLFAKVGVPAPLIGVAARAHWSRRRINPMHAGFMAQPMGLREFWVNGPGHEVARAVLKEHPEAELFICGPPLNTGRLFSQYPDQRVTRMTIQGGFIGPRVHGLRCIRLPETENATALPSYNLNDDPAGARVLLSAQAGERRLIGRNACHAIRYTEEKHKSRPVWPEHHPAVRLFDAAIDKILPHRPEKKIHDVVAAVAHFHPELFTWVRGRPFSRLTRDGRRLWGTSMCTDGDRVAIDLDIDRFWKLYLAPPRACSVSQLPSHSTVAA
jgi:pyrimidine-specific ribonucleoside hydrolase